MSHFDRYSATEYVEALRSFLHISKANFLKDYGFVDESEAPRRGRLPKYKDEPIRRLEAMVNEKAARCEATDTTVGERFQLARDYMGLNDSQVARELNVSRELVRRWAADVHRPTKLEELSTFLNVPLPWLEHGGVEHLPASSHLGVRVGEESENLRAQLKGMTQELILEIPDDTDEQYWQAYIEYAVFHREELKHIARQAGGRWQTTNGVLLFAPWIPIPEHGLSRRFWSDEVEAIIQEELANKPTVYGAWEAMRARCEAMGMSEDEFPRRITLHKRIEKERLRLEKFGVDLNEAIAESVRKYSEQ